MRRDVQGPGVPYCHYQYCIVYGIQEDVLGPGVPRVNPGLTRHDIANTNSVWCMAYTILPLPILYGVWVNPRGRGGGGSYSAQKPCNSIAIAWAMQVVGGNTRRMDSCTKASKCKYFL